MLRNYGQELREIERRERRHESAEPRRNPMETTGKPDTELEEGEQTDISSNEKSRHEAKQGTDFESEKGASSGSADSDAQEDAMIWAEDTGLTEAAETLFA